MECDKCKAPATWRLYVRRQWPVVDDRTQTICKRLVCSTHAEPFAIHDPIIGLIWTARVFLAKRIAL